MLISIDKKNLKLIHTEKNGREVYQVVNKPFDQRKHLELFTVKGETYEDWIKNETIKFKSIFVKSTGTIEIN